MSEVKTIRINKVLRELNISLDRAVEQLASHGFEIDARPTSKISEQEYQLLLDAFQTDRTKREASEEVSEEKRKEKEAIRQRIEEEKETKTQVFQARTELKGLRKVGKIDLEKKSEDKPEPKTETEPQPVEENVPEEIVEEPTKSTPEEEAKPAAKTEATPESPEEAGTEKVTTKYKKLTGLKIAGDKIDLKKFEKK
ncbi:MAG: translation initiation factor IF-2, partial [Flavobacteriaceae bacterium]